MELAVKIFLVWILLALPVAPKIWRLHKEFNLDSSFWQRVWMTMTAMLLGPIWLYKFYW